MRVRAQMGMVMNLDKCIGCHTCSVTCKNVWTNRRGAEYIWFNNVETKPGRGYPRDYEDQERWNGGWKLNRRGKLQLKAGGKLKKLATIFWNPDLPTIDDYYDPWTYDYDHLISAPSQDVQPAARPKSQVTGDDLDLHWGPNWDDDLAGSGVNAAGDPNRRGLEEEVRLEFEQAFMMYLPRICEHCVNPSCVASCPSGAMYKREEDGIVLVDQEACRSWRFCVSGCPYKKVYFNWSTGKAEKCNFCYPRIEAGLPTVCSETCVGRLRHVGIVLIDSDRVEEAASVKDEHELLESHLSLFCDPDDPEVREQALRDGVPQDWLEAASRSPVYAMCKRWRIALPLHPEYRTLPMVWYVPPLSPVESLGAELVREGGSAEDVFEAIEELRIPLSYLASFLAAGDTEPVRRSLRRLVAMRRYMRGVNIGGEADPEIARQVGMEPAEMEAMFRMVAIGDYDERYVIPRRHGEVSEAAFAEQGSCGLDFPQPGSTPSLLDGTLLAQSQAKLGSEGEASDLDLLEHLHRGGSSGGAGNGGAARGGGGG
ncbi:MAG: nitrate reductase subunit beta [Solirubrobacterales bacterium]|nr:nitrate reductase subunit beta [Solirubrobacterales bacterium]